MLEGVAVVANIFCDAPQTVSCTTDLHIFTFLLGFVVPVRTLLLEFTHQPKKNSKLHLTSHMHTNALCGLFYQTAPTDSWNCFTPGQLKPLVC